MRGRTDFLCGKGDIFYQGVTLQMCADGGYIAVPMRGPQFGYVFKDCEIVAETANPESARIISSAVRGDRALL